MTRAVQASGGVELGSAALVESGDGASCGLGGLEAACAGAGGGDEGSAYFVLGRN